MVGDDDYWEIYNEYQPRARKDHRCGECGRTIHKGERYHRQGGLHESSFVWHRTCAHCTVASEWLDVVCGGWVFGLRGEDFASHVVGDERELRSAALTRLYRWMRAGWFDRSGALRPVDDVREVTTKAVLAYQDRYRAAVA